MMSIVALVVVGRVGRSEVLLAVGLLPGIALGFLLSRYTSRWLDQGYTRTAVLLIAAVAGLSSVLHGVL
jgi:hypothetical protein